MTRKTSTPIKAALVLAFLAVLVLAWYLWDLPAFFNPAHVKAVLEAMGPLALLVYIVLIAATAILIPIPGPPLYVIAGAIFGPVLGTIYTVVGSAAGAAIAFLLARFLGRDFVESMVGKQVVICCECSEALLTRVIFFSRLLPLISFDVVSYGAGLTRMSLWKFTLATILGFIPMTFIYHIFGSAMAVSTSTAIALGVVIIAILFVLPYFLRRYDLQKFRPRLVTPARNPETGEPLDPCAFPEKEN
jgi:uncharacterized membrane protein YdjX (TVP38/TMEM64 family)